MTPRRRLRAACIETPIVMSSSIDIDPSLRGRDKVVAICKACGADEYLNAIGGQSLYTKDDFRSAGISLSFLQSDSIEYRQFDHPFVPWLSIVDVMMFNAFDEVKRMVSMWKPI
ncbi:MAG: WbqC family protein [Pararobbsia sp.]